MEQAVNQYEGFSARTVKLENNDDDYSYVNSEPENNGLNYNDSSYFNTSQNFNQSTSVHARQDFHRLTGGGRICKLSRLTGDPRPFPCSLCEKRFKLLHHLEAHVHTHTGVRPYPCDHCASRFTQLSSMRRHCHTIHGRVAVSRVGNKSLNESWTPDYVDHVEALTISMAPSVTPVDRVTCNICWRKFKSSFSLKRHTPNCRVMNFFHSLGGENNPGLPPPDESNMIRMRDLSDGQGDSQWTRKKRKLDKPCRSDNYVKQIVDELDASSRDEYDDLETNCENLNGFSYEGKHEANLRPVVIKFNENGRKRIASDVADNGDDVKMKTHVNNDNVKSEIVDDVNSIEGYLPLESTNRVINNIKIDAVNNDGDMKTEILNDVDNNESYLSLAPTNLLINNTKFIAFNGSDIKTEIADDVDNEDYLRLTSTNCVINNTKAVAFNDFEIKDEIADDFDNQDDSRLASAHRLINNPSIVASVDVLRVGKNNNVCNKKCFVDANVRPRPHVCFVCHKGFRLAHHLTNHILTHTGARPYTCFSCEHSFSQISSLNRHKRTSCRAAASMKCRNIQNDQTPVLNIINALSDGLF